MHMPMRWHARSRARRRSRGRPVPRDAESPGRGLAAYEPQLTTVPPIHPEGRGDALANLVELDPAAEAVQGRDAAHRAYHGLPRRHPGPPDRRGDEPHGVVRLP